MQQITLIKQPVQQEMLAFRQHYDTVLTHPDPLLGSALSFIRQRDGKMMRPLLVLLVAKALGNVTQSTFHAATTLELLHTASLVHDDVVDESNLRRGQASINANFGNKAAVLVGDYLLSLSLEESALTNDIATVQTIAALGKTLSKGELFQLENVKNSLFSEEAYFRIIGEKTASLFEACTYLGLRSAGASQQYAATLHRIGELMGLCFQIRDDIFDYQSDLSIGKPVGNDMQEGKLTLPLLHVLNTNPATPYQEMAQHVKQGIATTEEISQLVTFSHAQGGIKYAQTLMETYANEGHTLLDSLPSTEARRALHGYLDYIIGRSQ